MWYIVTIGSTRPYFYGVARGAVRWRPDTTGAVEFTTRAEAIAVGRDVRVPVWGSLVVVRRVVGRAAQRAA